MALASEHLTASELVLVVRQTIDYDTLDRDAVEALAMANRHRSALRQLQLIRPAEATAGGTGKGAGYSMVFDAAALKAMLEKVETFIQLRAGASQSLLGMFGMYGADTRYVQQPFCGGAEIYE